MDVMPDIVPITELRQDASALIARASETGSPIFITQHGRASAVLVSAGLYARTLRELEILRLLAEGEADIAAGNGIDLAEVMADAQALLGEE